MSKTYTPTPTDHESDCSSYSYSPDFKNYIDVAQQELFYIRLHPIIQQNLNQTNLQQNENLFRNEYKRMSLRRDRGILSKLTIGGINKKSVFEWKIVDKNKYEHSEGVLKELTIASGSKLSKSKNKNKPVSHQRIKGNLFETIFNSSIILGPDNKRFILDTINSGSVFERDLVVGDFIKSIDGEVLTSENLNNVLQRIQNLKSFKIVAYECNKDEFESSQEEIKITKPIDIALNKEKLFLMEAESHELIFSLNLIVKNEQVSDDSDDFTTIFSYPKKENNFLHKLKGSFLTISSIMKASFGTPPLLSVLRVHDTNFFITYTIRKNERQFIFLGFNSNYTKIFDVSFLTSNVMKYVDFVYPDLMTTCNFEHLSTACEMVKIQLLKEARNNVCKFEQLFSCSTYSPLPKEIVLRINDSLSELEAMDYRNWNEDLMELFGKFNISGSCLYYKTSLISSHFSETEMENVEIFLRQSCFKLLFENCLVREIAMWQRVYPKDYQSFNMNNDSKRNKVFLLVAAHGNLMMCVMLEENGYNINPEVETQSSNYLIYFLEEMDDILDHLKIVGIENLARIWINSAKRPQCKNLSETDIEKIQECVDSTGLLKTLKEEDDESEHDFESQIDSQKSSSGFDMNDFSDAIYKDFTDIIPQTVSFGPYKNVLYHFTLLDVSEGMIITSINNHNSNGKNNILIDIFRRGCIKIHDLLQNTIKFNHMISKENSKISHKATSMMAIKETGIMIQIKLNSGELAEFWIVGRLFGNRELFVCHESSIPQNMIELAFRINLSCLG